MTDRDALAQQMKSKIDEWNAEIDQIEQRLESRSDQARDGARAQLEALKEHRDRAKAALAELQGQSESGWEEARKRSEAAWSALSDGAGRALDSLRGKTDA